MPRSTWLKAFVVFFALWASYSQADNGWQPVQETIRKSDKDTRQYQAIRLDNGMVVLLVSDSQAVKSFLHSLSRWVPLKTLPHIPAWLIILSICP
jgi:protease-3